MRSRLRAQSGQRERLDLVGRPRAGGGSISALPPQRPRAVGVERVQQRRHPGAGGRHGAQHRRRPAACRDAVTQAQHVPQLADGVLGAVPVGLVHHVDVADLEDARLGRLHAVAHARGASTSTTVSAAPATSTSDWPTPTVSTRTTSKPAAVEHAQRLRDATARPPRCPRVAIDRMKTPGSVACSCIRTRSPSSAPPENGDDGSTASTATRVPAARSALTSAA